MGEQVLVTGGGGLRPIVSTTPRRSWTGEG